MDGILRIIQGIDTCDLNLSQMFWEDYGHQGQFIVGRGEDCDYITPFQIKSSIMFQLNENKLIISYKDNEFTLFPNEKIIIDESNELYILY